VTVTVPDGVPAFRQPFVGEPDLLLHTGFILAEEAALHRYLQHIVVPKRPDQDGAAKVGVWFRHPEGERNIQYPFITIDMINVQPNYALWTSEYVVDPVGLYRPSVSPTVEAPNEHMNLVVRPYLAFELTYQIAVHTRSSLHDKYLTSLFFTDIFPPRPFWMGVDADNTWRRVEMIDFAQQDIPETTETGTKRIFRKIYTITIQAEVPQDRIAQVWQALRVFVAVTDREAVDDYLVNVLAPNVNPDLTVPDEERVAHGELLYYVNDSEEVHPVSADAVGTASNAM
jgi:hypothetical protein